MLGEPGGKPENHRVVAKLTGSPIIFPWNSISLDPLRMPHRFATRNDKKLCDVLIGAPHLYSYIYWILNCMDFLITNIPRTPSLTEWADNNPNY